MLTLKLEIMMIIISKIPDEKQIFLQERTLAGGNRLMLIILDISNLPVSVYCRYDKQLVKGEFSESGSSQIMGEFLQMIFDHFD